MGKILHFPSKNGRKIPHQFEIRNFPRGTNPLRKSLPPVTQVPLTCKPLWTSGMLHVVSQSHPIGALFSQNHHTWAEQWLRLEEVMEHFPHPQCVLHWPQTVIVQEKKNETGARDSEVHVLPYD